MSSQAAPGGRTPAATPRHQPELGVARNPHEPPAPGGAVANGKGPVDHLVLANEARRRRATIRHVLQAGSLSVEDALELPELRDVDVSELLRMCAVARDAWRHAVLRLSRLGAPASLLARRLGELTPRQRALVVQSMRMSPSWRGGSRAPRHTRRGARRSE